jgi:hypothetical protein
VIGADDVQVVIEIVERSGELEIDLVEKAGGKLRQTYESVAENSDPDAGLLGVVTCNENTILAAAGVAPRAISATNVKEAVAAEIERCRGDMIQPSPANDRSACNKPPSPLTVKAVTGSPWIDRRESVINAAPADRMRNAVWLLLRRGSPR